MSLLATSCHGYQATITGWGSGITKAWAFAWLKSSDGSAHRGLVYLHQVIVDGTETYIGSSMSGANFLQAEANTGGVDVATPDGGDFYFWSGDQQNKWSVSCAVFDTATTNADLACIYGRAAATAKAATTRAITGDMSATANALVRISVLRDRRPIVSNDTGADSTNSTTKLAYLAIGQGSVPSSSQIQGCIDGTHPADLPGVWEYWDLTSSGAGLVGALQGVTLAPFGGSATTTWDGADNPTVSPPSGGGGTAVSFTGTIPTLNGTQGASFAAQSPTIASYFSGSLTPFAYSVFSGTLPAGLSLNSSTGVISGTPTTAGTSTGIVIRATDSSSNTANSNSFSIVIAPPAATSMTIALKQSDGTTAAASITGIEYAILNAATVAAATAVLDTGTGESTDGSGNLVLDLTGLGLTVGQVRYVVAGKSNGTVGANFDGWHGPAVAA